MLCIFQLHKILTPFTQKAANHKWLVCSVSFSNTFTQPLTKHDRLPFGGFAFSAFSFQKLIYGTKVARTFLSVFLPSLPAGHIGVPKGPDIWKHGSFVYR